MCIKVPPQDHTEKLKNILSLNQSEKSYSPKTIQKKICPLYNYVLNTNQQEVSEDGCYVS